MTDETNVHFLDFSAFLEEEKDKLKGGKKRKTNKRRKTKKKRKTKKRRKTKKMKYFFQNYRKYKKYKFISQV
jgi:hypothetical protein